MMEPVCRAKSLRGMHTYLYSSSRRVLSRLRGNASSSSLTGPSEPGSTADMMLQ